MSKTSVRICCGEVEYSDLYVYLVSTYSLRTALKFIMSIDFISEKYFVSYISCLN